VTFNGSGNFTLTATVGGSGKNKTLTNLQGQPVTSVSGTIASNTTWSGIIRITSDVLVPAGVKLTVNPGTLILINGILSGETGTDIDIQGTIESLGTAQSPVTFTAYNSGQCWGEIHHLNASPSLYQYTNISRAGNSPKGGHTNSGPAVRVENSTITFEFSSITDNIGKVMQASGSGLTFRRCQLARSVMGPEISGTALLFEDSFSTEMYGPDDNDGMYLHQQNPGQELILRRSVFAEGDDDALDTMSAIVQVEDCIFRDFVDKGISNNQQGFDSQQRRRNPGKRRCRRRKCVCECRPRDNKINSNGERRV
jgi:hypothetical protein